MRAQHVWIAQAGGVSLGSDDGVAIVDGTEGEEVIALGGGRRFIQSLADLSSGLVRVREKSDRGVPDIRRRPWLLLDHDIDTARYSAPIARLGGGRQTDLFGIALPIRGSGDDSGAPIGVGCTIGWCPVIAVRRTDATRIGRGPGDINIMSGSLDQQRQVPRRLGRNPGDQSIHIILGSRFRIQGFDGYVD